MCQDAAVDVGQITKTLLFTFLTFDWFGFCMFSATTLHIRKQAIRRNCERNRMQSLPDIQSHSFCCIYYLLSTIFVVRILHNYNYIKVIPLGEWECDIQKKGEKKSVETLNMITVNEKTWWTERGANAKANKHTLLSYSSFLSRDISFSYFTKKKVDRIVQRRRQRRR